jgi:Mg2+ and Co2+ transporter CorA
VIRAWRCEPPAGHLHETPPAEAVAAAVRSPETVVWIDFESTDAATATELLKPLAIHPLVLEDMVTDVNRPKVDNYGDYIYVVLHSARWDEERPSLRELDIVVGMNYLITYHEGATRSIDAAMETLARRPELLSGGPAHLLHFILDVLVDHYLPIMDRVGSDIDALEDSVFDQKRAPRTRASCGSSAACRRCDASSGPSATRSWRSPGTSSVRFRRASARTCATSTTALRGSRTCSIRSATRSRPCSSCTCRWCRTG